MIIMKSSPCCLHIKCSFWSWKIAHIVSAYNYHEKPMLLLHKMFIMDILRKTRTSFHNSLCKHKDYFSWISRTTFHEHFVQKTTRTTFHEHCMQKQQGLLFMNIVCKNNKDYFSWIFCAKKQGLFFIFTMHGLQCTNMFKNADRFANCVEPDQTAHFNGLIWVYTVYSHLTISILRNNFSLPVNYSWLTHVVWGHIMKY